MTVIIIPAKGKSSRLKNKNMKFLLNKPTLSWTIDYSLNFLKPEKIFVSSESDTIKKYCEKCGIGFIKRPPYLLGDTPILDVYRHAVVYLEAKGIYKNIQTVIGLQPDHPDRREKLSVCYKIFKEKRP